MPETPPATDPASPPRPRRTREDLAVLAADFVNSRIHRPPRREARWVLPATIAAGVASILLVVAWHLWPAAVRAPAPAGRAVDLTQAWNERYAADRERSRQQLQQGTKFLGKLAVADADCRMHVSEITPGGTLTHAEAARLPGARTDGAGHIFLPPVVRNDGQAVAYEVLPNGCVRVTRVAPTS